jgi:hypothetical protein
MMMVAPPLVPFSNSENTDPTYSKFGSSLLQDAHFRCPTHSDRDVSANVRLAPILLQKSKIEQPQNLAKVDLWISLLLRRLSTPLRRSMIAILDETIWSMANALCIAHLFDEAVQQSNKTLRMDPNFAIGHYELGQAHIRAIDSKLALLRHFNYAIEQRGRTCNPNLGGCPSYH